MGAYWRLACGQAALEQPVAPRFDRNIFVRPSAFEYSRAKECMFSDCGPVRR